MTGGHKLDNSYLVQNLEHHNLFARLLPPEEFRHLAAWRLVAKTMERSPGRFMPVSGYYPAGDPLIWLVNLETKSKLAINEGPFGSVTPFDNRHQSRCPVCDALDDGDSRVKVSELLVDTLLDHIVQDLETCLSVRPTNLGSKSESGADLIREFLDLSLMWKSPLRSTGLFYDWGSFNPGLIKDYPSLARLASLPAWPDPEDDRFEEEYQDWLGPFFLVHPGMDPTSSRLVVDIRDMVVHEKHAGSFRIAEEVVHGKTLRELASDLADAVFEDIH